MRQQIIDGYSQMRINISKQTTKCLEDIYKYLDNEVISLDYIYEIILDMLSEVYALTAAAIKNIYNIDNKPLDEEDIEKLIYSKDGKSMLERLQEHFTEAKKKDNFKEYFFNRIVLITDTESLTVSNAIIHGKMKKNAKYVEVISGSEYCAEGDCEYWQSKGKIPIEELTELPPYHPDCECEVIYYFE